MKEIKAKWLQFKQNVELNGLKYCKSALIVPVSNVWPERGASSVKHVKVRMRNTIKMDLLDVVLMLSMNGPSPKNKNEVLKIMEKAVLNYESLDHWKNRIGGKYNTKKKSDVAVQTVVDLNMKKVQQNTEAALESPEQEHNKEYV